MVDRIWLPAGAVTSKDVAGAPHGGFSGYAAVFGNVDQQDDIVTPGAFRKSLARLAGRRVPLVVDHDHSVDGVIGSVTDAREDVYGLHIRAVFSSTAKAQDVRSKVREGHLSGLSIFGPIIGKSHEFVAGRQVRKLTEVDLMEVTLTAYPANARALVSTATAKGVAAATDIPRWEDDMRAALRISSAPVRRVAIENLMKARYPAAKEAVPMFTSYTPPGAAADRILDEAKAAGWVPTVPDRGPCGQCTPCKNKSTSSCVRWGTREAAAMRAAVKARESRQHARTVDGMYDALVEEIDWADRRKAVVDENDRWVWAG